MLGARIAAYSQGESNRAVFRMGTRLGWPGTAWPIFRWNATECKLLKNGGWEAGHATWWPPSGRGTRVLRPVLGFSGHCRDTLNFWKKIVCLAPILFWPQRATRTSLEQDSPGSSLGKGAGFWKALRATTCSRYILGMSGYRRPAAGAKNVCFRCVFTFPVSFSCLFPLTNCFQNNI